MPNSNPGTYRLRILVPLVLLVFAGCAYYNTFYLARRYYREAQKEQERSVSEGVAAAASSKYDQVIRQCNKILTDYPKSKWVDDATYLLGASLYGKGDYGGAIRRLDEFETKFPKSPFVPDAKLVKGLSHYQHKDYDEADSIFTALDKAYPKLERRWELYFYAGESRVAQRDYTGALGWYRRAVQAAGQRRQRADALRRTGDALFDSDRKDSAAVVYAQTLKEEERPKQRLDVILRRGQALRDLKKYDEALAFLSEWHSAAITENREGELMLRVYELDALLGRTNDAMKGYKDLVERFGGTNVAWESQFQIGYLYESALNDLDAAGREYDKLRQTAGTSNTFGQQATRRGQSLATLKKYREQLAADTTGARARTAFQLAEVYYFELGKTDSALTQYSTVEALYPRSAYAPKSAYARLWISAYDKQDTMRALALTDSIATRYRGTRYAESALYFWKQWSGRTDERTALFDSLLAHPDTSAAGQYVEEKEAAPTAPSAVAAPTGAAPDSGYQVPPEVMKQLEAAAAAAQKARDEARKKRLGGGAKPAGPGGATSAAPGGGAAPADSTRPALPPAPTPAAPPDTSRTAPADTTRKATPPDTTGSGSRQ